MLHPEAVSQVNKGGREEYEIINHSSATIINGEPNLSQRRNY